MKKIGLLSLALVLALGALGAAYAPWTDQVEIKQVVQTGSLEVGVFGVYNYFEEKEVMDVTLEHGGEIKFRKYVPPTPPGSLIPGDDIYPFYESVTISIGNMYPSVWVREDFYIGVGGTVPVHLYPEFEFFGDWELLYECMDIIWKIVLPDGTVYDGSGIPNFEKILTGLQVHPCETIIIWLDKHLLQCGGENQGLEGGFTLTVKAYQYNWDPSPEV